MSQSRDQSDPNSITEQINGFYNTDSSSTQLLVQDHTSTKSLEDLLMKLTLNSRSAKWAVAFVSRKLVNRVAHWLSNSGTRVQLLTSTMGGFNNPETLRHIHNNIPEIEIRLFAPAEHQLPLQVPFHVKAYLFDKIESTYASDTQPAYMNQRLPKTGTMALLIGSSNLTGSAMGSGNSSDLNVDINNGNGEMSHQNQPTPIAQVEWNVLLQQETPGTGEAIYQAEQQFQTYWNKYAWPVDSPSMQKYVHRKMDYINREPDKKRIITPTEQQQQALDQLWDFYQNDYRRAAIIAPTGFGKTVLAAFWVKRMDPKRVLFLVHREQILDSATKTFETVLPDTWSFVKLGGQAGKTELLGLGSRELPLCVFAMVATFSQQETLAALSNHFFDLIIVDEFHHAAAPTYKRILEHVDPQFLVGMTATPERTDGKDVLELCHNNIAFELRLFTAIEHGLLTPFQYFAIQDPTDYTNIRWTGMGYDETALEHALSNDTRAALIIANLKRYIPSFGKIKALAFCSNVGHSRFMAKAFTKAGIPAVALWGESSYEERNGGLTRLADETDELQIICSVGIFSEGIDIPSLTHVLLLRPTDSASIFLQQIGRGLRLHPAKEFLVILDFVGNYRNNFTVKLLLSRQTEDAKRILGESELTLPESCSIDADTEVTRIWQESLEEQLSKLSWDEQFKRLYLQIIESEFDHSTPGLSMLDFYLNPLTPDPRQFIAKGRFSSWLRALDYMNGLTPLEKSWLDTPAELLLQHIELELKPNRSYKMAVLHSIIHLSEQKNTTEWKVNEIAELFLGYYLGFPVRTADYDELSKAIQDQKELPIGKVIQHIRKNPLNYLSDKEEKPFILDGDEFKLKPEYEQYWNNREFMIHVKDRVTYSEMRYWKRKEEKAKNS